MHIRWQLTGEEVPIGPASNMAAKFLKVAMGCLLDQLTILWVSQFSELPDDRNPEQRFFSFKGRVSPDTEFSAQVEIEHWPGSNNQMFSPVKITVSIPEEQYTFECLPDSGGNRWLDNIELMEEVIA